MLAKHLLELGDPIAVHDIQVALQKKREALARANNDPNALRVCTLNLVAFCHEESRCAATLDVLSSMVIEHPGRLFLVHAHRDTDQALLQARVAVDGMPSSSGVPPSYSELIDINATGPDVDFLPSILTSLLESDQPACAWWATAPTFGPTWQRMAHVCDRMIVDSSEMDPWDLMRVLEFVRAGRAEAHRDDHAALGDLNWARAKPFMALTARFFESPAVAERFAEVQRITVRYAPAAGHATAIGPAMLGAWVKGRLEKTARLAHGTVSPRVELLKSPRTDLVPGEIAELVLSGSGSNPLELAVVRAEGAKAVVAEARKGVDSMASQRLRIQTRDLGWLLAQELQISDRDPLYEAAFIGAIDILREARR
jgi:glucose-6-phosphate dehydrogenase assembly protein OpcA